MKTAAVFPGQGSQKVGMGKVLYENFPLFKESFEEASDALGLDVKKLCFDGPEEELQLTKNTQPAIVTCSVATFRVLEKEFDFKPDFTAGHSVGEYSALVASGVLSFAHALKAVRLRGESMQEAVPIGKGAMAALLGPSEEQVKELCDWVERENSDICLEAANFNCPGQTVISGHARAIEFLKDHLSEFEFNPKPKKVRLIPLKVSAPFHCRLMMPAQETMSEFFHGVPFKSAEIPVAQNFNASLESSGEKIKNNLIQQISQSVLWTKSIIALKDESVSRFIEIGTGTTLSGLIKKIDSEHLTIFNTDTLENMQAAFA